jgi:anti-anti-sigma factor
MNSHWRDNTPQQGSEMSTESRQQLPIRIAGGFVTLAIFANLGCSNSEPDPPPVSDSSTPEVSGPQVSDSSGPGDVRVAVEGYTRLEVSRMGDVLVARLKDSRLDNSAGDIGDEFLRLARDSDAKSIILDFGSVEFFSHTPLAKLMAMQAEVDKHDKILRLCSLRGDVGKVFQIMQFDEVFEIEPDVATALQSLR